MYVDISSYFRAVLTGGAGSYRRKAEVKRMKLVIDIPIEIIEAAKTDLWCGSPTVGDAIKHGTPYEERPHGEWIEHRTQDIFGYFHSEYECSNCHDDVFQKTEWQFCPNCGASMISSNSKIEKSKSAICPCIECCEIDNSEPCRKGCSEYKKWKEGGAE